MMPPAVLMADRDDNAARQRAEYRCAAALAAELQLFDPLMLDQTA
jgi:hypothetical protein